MTIEDKKQQENLKNFDRNLKESTGQLAWFLLRDVCSFCANVRDGADIDGIFIRMRG